MEIGQAAGGGIGQNGASLALDGAGDAADQRAGRELIGVGSEADAFDFFSGFSQVGAEIPYCRRVRGAEIP